MGSATVSVAPVGVPPTGSGCGSSEIAGASVRSTESFRRDAENGGRDATRSPNPTESFLLRRLFDDREPVDLHRRHALHAIARPDYFERFDAPRAADPDGHGQFRLRKITAR